MGNGSPNILHILRANIVVAVVVLVVVAVVRTGVHPLYYILLDGSVDRGVAFRISI